MAANSLVARISRWDTLVTNLEPDLTDMQHLSADFAQLKEILLKSREFEAHQELLRSQSQGNTAERQSLAQEGDRLRRRIGASLQWKHGFGSENLLKFGFRPRRQPARSKKQAKPVLMSVSPEAA